MRINEKYEGNGTVVSKDGETLAGYNVQPHGLKGDLKITLELMPAEIDNRLDLTHVEMIGDSIRIGTHKHDFLSRVGDDHYEERIFDNEAYIVGGDSYDAATADPVILKTIGTVSQMHKQLTRKYILK